MPDSDHQSVPAQSDQKVLNSGQTNQAKPEQKLPLNSSPDLRAHITIYNYPNTTSHEHTHSTDDHSEQTVPTGSSTNKPAYFQ